MNFPEHITFTGVDAHTPPKDMLELSSIYNIEWGVLFSPSRQGNENRYPALDVVQRLLDSTPPTIRLAAHLCGAASRQLIADGSLPPELEKLLDTGRFQRVQVNTSDPHASPPRLGNWGTQRGLEVIMQTRNATVFPGDDSVQWLYDASGGRGVAPEAWPLEAVEGRLCGYAGGIGPTSVRSVIESVGPLAKRYWLDMETGVRDGKDQFSLVACLKVCVRTYGFGSE